MAIRNVILSTLIFVCCAEPVLAQENNETRQPTADQKVAARAATAFQEGLAALERNEVNEALNSFISAVKLTPDNASYVNQLGRVYLQAGKLDQAWVTFRRAIAIDPNSEQYQQDFMSIWLLFRSEGMFNIGVGRNKVHQSLGKPDRRLENGLTRFIYGFMAIDFRQDGTLGRVLDLRGLEVDHVFPADQIIWNFDLAPLTKVSHFISRQGDFETWVDAGETVRDAKRRLIVERFASFRDEVTLKDFAVKLEQSVARESQQAQWKRLSESSDDFVYRWSGRVKSDNRKRFEVGRVLKGSRDFYRFALEASYPLSDQEIIKWTERLKRIQLKRLPRIAELLKSSDEDSAEATRFLAWELGCQLSSVAWAHAQGRDSVLIETEFAELKKFARYLRVELKPLPPRGVQPVSNTAAVLDYLLNQCIRSVGRSLRKEIGDQQAALFELAIKSNLLLRLYSPNDERSRRAIASIASHANRAKLPAGLLAPLFTAIDEEVASEQFVELSIEFQKQVTELLYPSRMKRSLR